MGIKVKDLSYGTLISHTFPGFLLGCQIIIPFELFAPTSFIDKIFIDPWKLNNVQIIICMLVLFILSTLFGSILDGIHNLIFIKYNRKSLKNQIDIIKLISIDQLDIYKEFYEYDPWFAFESYANIGIALTPGLIFLPWLLYRYGFGILFIGIFILIYSLIYVTLFCAAITYCKEAEIIEKALIERFETNNHVDGP